MSLAKLNLMKEFTVFSDKRCKCILTLIKPGLFKCLLAEQCPLKCHFFKMVKLLSNCIASAMKKMKRYDIYFLSVK